MVKNEIHFALTAEDGLLLHKRTRLVAAPASRG